MTDRQSRKLYVLGRLRGIHIPFVIWALGPSKQRVTKAEAAAQLIDDIEGGQTISQDYIDSLGRGPVVRLRPSLIHTPERCVLAARRCSADGARLNEG